MLRTLAAAAALFAALFTIPALAAPPADQDACHKLAFSLAEQAAGKKLPEAAALKVDELITRLETQCTDGKLVEAEATAREIEAALGK